MALGTSGVPREVPGPWSGAQGPAVLLSTPPSALLHPGWVLRSCHLAGIRDRHRPALDLGTLGCHLPCACPCAALPCPWSNPTKEKAPSSPLHLAASQGHRENLLFQNRGGGSMPGSQPRSREDGLGVGRGRIAATALVLAGDPTRGRGTVAMLGTAAQSGDVRLPSRNGGRSEAVCPVCVC